VDFVLDDVSDNPDVKEILAVHPDLIWTDVQACFAYVKHVVIGGYQTVVRESMEANPCSLFPHPHSPFSILIPTNCKAYSENPS
jgi:hypothetical protein